MTEKNITPYEPQDDNTKEVNIQTDIELAKGNIKGMLEQLTPAFLDLVDIARQSQHEKYYAALSSLAKTMIDANKELIGVAKTDKEIEKLSIDNEQKKAGSADTVQNVNQLYVSSSEMLDQILDKLSKAKKKADKDLKNKGNDNK